MTWPIVSWIMSSSSSSSSSEYDNELEEEDLPNDDVSCDVPDQNHNDTNDNVDSVSPSTQNSPCQPPLSTAAVTVAVPGIVDPSSSTSKRRRIEDYDDPAAAVTAVRLVGKKISQKTVWTKEDELELLQSFFDYTRSRRTGPSNIGNSFYDQVKPEFQLRFNKSQLVEKLRRLKRKYQNVSAKKISSMEHFRFRTPHDRATFEISHKIWASRTTDRLGTEETIVDDDQDDCSTADKAASFTRPKTRSQTQTQSRSAGLKNTKGGVLDEGCSWLNDRDEGDTTGLIMGLALNPMSLSFGRGLMKLGDGEVMADEKWREQQIMELEVYSKRLELVQDQIKAALKKLRSTGDSPV